MTDQITVPRETWDAMREALDNWLELDSSDIDRKLLIRDTKDALTAANAVSAEQYSIDADPQGIRARVVLAVVGAMAYGARGENKPPEGHWLNEAWDIARAEREDAVDRVVTLFESMEAPYLPDIVKAIEAAHGITKGTP